MWNYALTTGLPCSVLPQVTRPRTQSCSYKGCLLRNKKQPFTSFHLLKWLFKRVICIILHFIIWVLHFTPNTYRTFSPGLYGFLLFLMLLSVTSRIQNHVRGKGALLWSNDRSLRTVAPGKVLSCHLRPGRTQSNPRLWAPRAWTQPSLMKHNCSSGLKRWGFGLTDEVVGSRGLAIFHKVWRLKPQTWVPELRPVKASWESSTPFAIYKISMSMHNEGWGQGPLNGNFLDTSRGGQKQTPWYSETLRD